MKIPPINEHRSAIHKSILRHKLKEIDKGYKHVKTGIHELSHPKEKALEGAKKEIKWRTVPAKRSSPEEQERKMKMFASQSKAHHEMTNKDKIDYQHRVGKAYSE